MQKKEKCYASHSRRWDTHNHLHQSIPIIPQQATSQTAKSNVNVHVPWTCVSFGQQIRLFLGRDTEKGKPIYLNGAIHTWCAIIEHIVASAAEAELGALFINAKEGKVLCLTLEEMGHKQSPTPIHTDNTTVSGITNGTIKRQRSRTMEVLRHTL